MKSAMGSSKLRSSLATYARMKAVICIIVSAIIVVVLVLIGRSLMKTKHSASAMMVVKQVGFVADASATATGSATASACTPIITKESVRYQCIVSGEFTVRGRTVAASNLKYSGSRPIGPGEALKVYYDPNNPSDVVTGKVGKKTLGIVLIVVAVLIALLSVIGTVFVFSSKGYAMIQGGGGAMSGLTGALFGR